MVRGDRLVREGSLYSRQRRRPVTAVLAALTLGVGFSLFAIPLSSVQTPNEQPTPTAPPTVPTPEKANIETSSQPHLVPLDILVTQNFSSESALRLNILDGKYQHGEDTIISVCTNESGQPLTGKVSLAEINVRREPNTLKPPTRSLLKDSSISSRIKAAVKNWKRPHEDTWRGIEDLSGNLEFVAQTYRGHSHLTMDNEREVCTPLNLEPRVGILAK